MKDLIIKLLNISKKIALFIMAIFGLIFAVFFILSPQDNKMKAIFLDVGQGDSSLIKAPGGQVILVDGGPDNKVLQGLGKNLPFWRRRIDFLVLSHYHDDHITGLIEIIKRYQVGTLIYQEKMPDSLLVSELLRIASQKKVRLLSLGSQASLSLGSNCDLNLLNPAVLGIKEDANNSLVSKLDCEGRELLFAGDNNEKVEEALLGSNWPLKADIFKASHHGSNTSNSADFLEKVAPRLIVISVGADNRFGHPGRYFLERAAALGIPVKRTDIDGEIGILVK